MRNPTDRQRVVPLFFLLIVSLFPAVTARADRVDDYVREQMRRRHIPGVALAVVRGGKVIKEQGYGLASVELNVTVTPDTVFEIGSLSKQITAAAIMLLVEDGRLALDDPIAKYLPETPEAWSGVTIRHLLTHTSGIRNYTGLTGFELTERLKRDEFIRRIGVHPLNFNPGEAHSYGNSGYSLLGYVIEAVTGKSYWDFVGERIFRPLGMTATTDRDPRRIVMNRAVGYEWTDGRLAGRDYDLTDIFSAGAIVSTVRDLVKWEAALAGGRVLKGPSLEQIWTPVRLNNGKTYPYGFGWYIETLRDRRVIRHTGHTAGFSASLARYPDDQLTVIVLTNLGTLGNGGRIGQGVAKLYAPTLSLKNLRAEADSDPALTRKIESALRGLLQGQPDEAAFTPERFRALANEGAKETWRQVASYGPLGQLTFAGIETQARIVRYRAGVGSHLILVRFALTPEGRIAEVNIEEEE
jgi:CubicO group peptidase (beta-lactamase class C family)